MSPVPLLTTLIVSAVDAHDHHNWKVTCDPTFQSRQINTPVLSDGVVLQMSLATQELAMSFLVLSHLRQANVAVRIVTSLAH